MQFINRKHTLKNYTLRTIKVKVQPLAAATVIHLKTQKSEL